MLNLFFKNKKITFLLGIPSFIINIILIILISKKNYNINNLLFTGNLNYYEIFTITAAIIFNLNLNILNFLKYLKNIKKYNYQDYLLVFSLFTILIILSYPIINFNLFFYNLDITIIPFKRLNRFVMYYAVIHLIVFVLFLKNKESKSKKLYLIYFSFINLANLFLIYNYNSFFEKPFFIIQIPISAISLLLISFVFENKKIYSFSLCIGLISNILNLIYTNILDSNMFSINNLYSYVININLITILLSPLLLGYFKFKKMKDFYPAIIFSNLYFIFLIIISFAYYNNSLPFTYNKTLFDKLFLANTVKKYSNYYYTFYKFKNYTYTLINYDYYPYLFLLNFLYYFIFTSFLLISIISISDFVFKVKVYEDKFNHLKKLKIKQKIYIDEKTREVLKMVKPNLKVNNFSKKYARNNFYSARNISFEITEGKIVGFIGHNGAGKSTLIKTIVGIQNPTAGLIEVCGYDISKHPTEAKFLIGYVSDNYALYEDLTGREYIYFQARIFNVDKKIIKQRCEELASYFNILPHIDREIKTFSHGMKQKISIIASLMHEPKIWILDEPLTGLDPMSSYSLKTLIKDYAKRGNIVIFSSHIIEVVENLCDEIVIIKKGQMILNDNIKSLKQKHPVLEDMYINLMNQDEK